MPISTADFLKQQAELAALKRRVAHVERWFLGRDRPVVGLDHLKRLYILAGHSQAREVSEDTAILWNSALQKVYEPELLLLAKDTKDPFPWRPLLMAVYRHEQKYPTQVKEGLVHMVDVATSYLEIVGLSPPVTIEDVMGGMVDNKHALVEVLKSL